MENQMIYHVAELFSSINGEARSAGELAVFVRFVGCNLRCSYCDTAWAIEGNAPFTPMTKEEIVSQVRSTGIHKVTLTGGEPLLQPGLHELMEELLGDEHIELEVETNGAVDISPYLDLPRTSMTLDYKCPSSGMEDKMLLSNFEKVRPQDTVKFVVGSQEDLVRANEIVSQYHLQEKAQVYFSAVFGKIDPKDIVNFMLEHKLNGVRFQLQIHKFIWDPDKRGV